MTLFISGILVLIVGYFTYGKLMMRLCRPDERPTPALTHTDGIDYLPMPKWRNMLIQLLNIAGVGPVIGVIIGIKFGTICFIIIPIGCILAGATHDLVAGFMSLRSNGANLPRLTQKAFGKRYQKYFSFFTIFLLLLVVAVFINIPAGLTTQMVTTANPAVSSWAVSPFLLAAIAIFIYYVAATLFPVDKIIGKVYPFFGGLLLLGSLAMMGSLIYHGWQDPTLLTETEAFKAGMFQGQPIIPCLFVTIACGIISGFHATQSPIVARTMVSEKEACATFYGMMILEGIIAMIWAAAGLYIYNLFPELMTKPPMGALYQSTKTLLGSSMGTITVVSVIVLAITSGDTALRGLRLTIAESLHLPQKALSRRLTILIPLIAVITAILIWSNQDANSFKYLWSYFAWGNQIMAASTLMMCSVWLKRHRNVILPTLIPGAFMTFVIFSFILWTSTKYTGCPYGFGLPLPVAYIIAAVITLACCVTVYLRGRRRS